MEEVKEHFEYGNLILECSCGKSSTIATALKNGVSLYLPTQDGAYWSMGCADCGHKFKLSFIRSNEEEINIAKENESVQQGSTEDEVHTGISDDTESDITIDSSSDRSTGDNN